MSSVVARAIRAGYRERQVLRGVDLVAQPGELVALIGPNGAGKSTLLRVLGGLLRPSSGSVTIDGTDVTTLDRRSVARHVAVVPQVFETLFPFTVREIVALGRTSRLGPFGTLGADDARAVARALDDIGATDLADRRIDRVSGGERQRAVLAMALAQEAGVLLLDEPTAHLDPAHQRATLDRVATLARARGLAVVAVLHDLNLAAAFASRVVLLADGAVVREGEPGLVITAELVGRVFGPGLRVVAHDGRPFVVPEPAVTVERRARAG
ncbi:MAG TPA: ABC transporter ATP-binding protein [Candidatus Limnocylindria bacterium]|nr:ABC transporter ATP-binding protein [Candidatus Limnocylindria bacterium]